MPRKGRKRKPDVPRKKRIRDAIAADRVARNPGLIVRYSLWPHSIQVAVGDHIETSGFEETILGTVVAVNEETLVVDRSRAGRISIKAPWMLRKVSLLERIALEVADAEKAHKAP